MLRRSGGGCSGAEEVVVERRWKLKEELRGGLKRELQGRTKGIGGGELRGALRRNVGGA